MKIYLKETVYEAALRRIRWLFDEFENVNVSFSGGKDSTVTLHLALQVAEEKGRLPLPVMFVDQEAEWDLVIEYMRRIMSDPRVQPYWYQIPFRLFNATSQQSEWMNCWEPGAEWMREKEPGSIHDNTFGPKCDRFHEVFTQHLTHVFDGPVVNLSGIRTNESMSRYTSITKHVTYKGETWGKIQEKKRPIVNMYPLYDWTDSDIWKAIHENGWRYCKIYDLMYQYGIPLRDMRVSSVTHENAIRHLIYLQEFEGDMWNRLTKRLSGVNTVKHLKNSMMRCPRELPKMFESWGEYRDYLLEKLVVDPDHKAKLRHAFDKMDWRYVDEIHDKLHKVHIACVLTGDRFHSKMASSRHRTSSGTGAARPR